MKRTITALFLVVAVLSLSMTAYAADATTGSMTVSYEYTAPGNGDGGNGGDTDNPTTYTINIPASVNINSVDDVVAITAAKNDVAEGKKVLVTVDWDKSYDSNGFFNLYKNKGELNEESMRCRVFLYTDSTLTTMKTVDYLQDPPRYSRIAEFSAGSTAPSYGGFLCFDPLTINLQVSSGTYTGTLHFNIEVTDE